MFGRSRRGAPLAGAAWLVVAVMAAGCGFAAPDGVTDLSLSVDPADELQTWRDRGFAPLVPPVHLPSSSPDEVRVAVWAKLPPGSITTTASEDGPTLAFGPGAELDRIEWFGPPGQPRIADVRGSRVLPDGSQRHRVMRPDDGVLFGVEWAAMDPAAHAAATDRMAMRLQDSAPLRALPSAGRTREIDAFRAKNNCNGCHQPQLSEARATTDRLVRRATDASGFYVPRTVLGESAPLESYGRHDLNVGRPHVLLTCPDGSVPTSSGERPDITCPSKQIPQGRFELRAALDAGDEHARAVCASRRVLFEAMNEAARAAFAPSFHACRIGLPMTAQLGSALR